MGMFDSFYDHEGREHQTKAFNRELRDWSVGDVVPFEELPTVPLLFQIETLGTLREDGQKRLVDTFVTIIGATVAVVNAKRDPRLPLVSYSGRRVFAAGSDATDVAGADHE